MVENFLEIHLFWAGKGTCCVPVAGYYGPSISAISVTPGVCSIEWQNCVLKFLVREYARVGKSA